LFRCVLDTTRLVDLLLVLLFEGRKALPKSGAMPVGGPSGHMAGLRRLDSAGERSHRQLIDCIRSKDTDALIDAIDNGSESLHVCLVWLIGVVVCLLAAPRGVQLSKTLMLSLMLSTMAVSHSLHVGSV